MKEANKRATNLLGPFRRDSDQSEEDCCFTGTLSECSSDQHSREVKLAEKPVAPVRSSECSTESDEVRTKAKVAKKPPPSLRSKLSNAAQWLSGKFKRKNFT